MRGYRWLIFAGILVLSGSAWADEKCKSAPLFKGVPTGAAAFDSREEAPAGEVKILNFGDELIVSGGEGGFKAVTLWAEDKCGLWLQESRGGSYLEKKVELHAPTYRFVKSRKDGSYEVEALGQRFQIKAIFPGRFEVTLLTAIGSYEGE